MGKCVHILHYEVLLIYSISTWKTHLQVYQAFFALLFLLKQPLRELSDNTISFVCVCLCEHCKRIECYCWHFFSTGIEFYKGYSFDGWAITVTSEIRIESQYSHPTHHFILTRCKSILVLYKTCRVWYVSSIQSIQSNNIFISVQNFA